MEKKCFTWPIRVYYEDTDCAGIVYYANYLKFLERARTEWFRTLGVHQQENMNKGLNIVFVIVGVDIQYLKPARLDDKLEVRSWIGELHKASLYFEQEIWRGDELLVTARVRAAELDSVTRRPKPMPDFLFNQLTEYKK